MHQNRIALSGGIETSVNFSNNRVYTQKGWIGAKDRVQSENSTVKNRLQSENPTIRMEESLRFHTTNTEIYKIENCQVYRNENLEIKTELNGNIPDNSLDSQTLSNDKKRGILTRQRAVRSYENSPTPCYIKVASNGRKSLPSRPNDCEGSEDKRLHMKRSSETSGTSDSHRSYSVDSETSSVSSSSHQKHPIVSRQRTFRIDSVDGLDSLLVANLPLDSQILKHKLNGKRYSQPTGLSTKSHRFNKRHSQPTNKLEDTRLVVLGSGGVGKSSLVAQFINGFFPSSYQPTVEDSHRHLVQLPDGVFQTIEILDTAGFHQFPAMRHLSIQSGDAFVVVYSVDNNESFQEALSLVDLIKDIKLKRKTMTEGSPVCPIMIVGNKNDLENDRKVSTELARREANERKCFFVEATAKDNANVQKMFSELLVTIFGVGKILEELDLRKQSRFRRFSKHVNGRIRKSFDKIESNGNVGNMCGEALCTIL